MVFTVRLLINLLLEKFEQIQDAFRGKSRLN